jgi:hypothetical protein
MKAFAFVAVLSAVVYLNVRAEASLDPKDRVIQLTECFGEYFEIDQEITVHFSDYVRWGEVCPGGKGPNGECVLGGWAWPLDHPSATGNALVTYYRPFVEGDCDLCALPTKDKHLVRIAAHEVSHISGNLGETEAWAAARTAIKESTCQ